MLVEPTEFDPVQHAHDNEEDDDHADCEHCEGLQYVSRFSLKAEPDDRKRVV